MHRLFELRASTLLKLLKRLDAFRKPQRVQQFVTACEADARGRLGLEEQPYPQGQWLLDAFAAAQQVTAKSVDPRYQGVEIGNEIDRLRILAIAELQALRP